MIEFRKATIADVEALTRMRVRFLCDGRDDLPHDRRRLHQASATFFETSILCGSFVSWIALDGDDIVSTGGLSVYSTPPNRKCPSGLTGYITNMYTLPEYRRQGLGTRIFRLTVEEARSLGCDRILLNSTEMGRHMYEQMGFTAAENMMQFFPASPPDF